MQLSYRGNSYSYNPVFAEMTESGETGTYRGQTYPIKYPRHIPVAQPSHELTYRGVSYRTNSRGVAAPSTSRPAVSPAPAVAYQGSVTPIRRTATKSYDAVHRMHIQRRLHQRMEAARARGDQQLLNLLEIEMRQVS
jgi:Domain of unknown function (DUF4278)